MRGRLLIASSRSKALVIALVCAASLAAQPARIVSTAPSITEILFALGVGDRVVGVTTYCHYPPDARKLPKIGTFSQPNLEAILSARPDLVLVLKTPIHSKSQYAATNLNVVEVQLTSVSQIVGAVQAIGRAAGVPDRAASLSARITRALRELRSRVASKPPVTVMYLVGRTPGALEGMIAAGKGSYLDDIMTIAGGRNILADSPVDYPRVSMEQVLARNPQVIVDLGDHPDPNSVTSRDQAAIVALWSRHSALRAVRDKRVHAVASTIFTVPGPRVVEAARAFARILHPELFR